MIYIILNTSYNSTKPRIVKRKEEGALLGRRTREFDKVIGL